MAIQQTRSATDRSKMVRADILGGLAFVLDAATELGVDRDRVGFFGGSSGGHLALLAGYRAEEILNMTVRAVVNVYGPTDSRYIADDYRGSDWYRIVTLFYVPSNSTPSDVNVMLACDSIASFEEFRPPASYRDFLRP